ncbi:hypothetical protein E2542_SST27079 [Spatholobus suberectus]|nr:hypothetical protein E2542_SST27079 [Spatholobus suberectus]
MDSKEAKNLDEQAANHPPEAVIEVEIAALVVAQVQHSKEAGRSSGGGAKSNGTINLDSPIIGNNDLSIGAQSWSGFKWN